jgi:hypothetical protein
MIHLARRSALAATVSALAFDNATPSMVTTPEAVLAAKAAIASGASLPQDEMLKRSTDSAAMVEYWDLSDAIVDGLNAMKLAGEKYMPKFLDEDSDNYAQRLKYAKMTNIYRDTVEGLASKPFEQEVALAEDDNTAVPDQLKEFTEDVDGSGNNLTMFAAATFFNGINSAVDWIFVDNPKTNPNIRTKADEKAAGVRPYWSHVLGRNILEVNSAVINGQETLTYMRIYEPGQLDHVRVFQRDDTGGVTWTLYEKSKTIVDGKTMFILSDTGTVDIGIIPLVPFWTGRRDGRSWRFFPAMRDAADLQVNLYRNESGLEFAKVLTAYPMLAANGIRPMLNEDGKTIKKVAVGPNRVLYGPPDASGVVGSWEYVEPAATSLKFLADDIDHTIQQLREIGRQPLTAQSGNLTVITTAVAAGKAKSAVVAWALGLKNALEEAMLITCQWLSIDAATYDPVVSVYTDFDEFMEGKDLDTLNIARGTKDISQLTYWDELKRRGVLSAEFDADVETDRLLKELPSDSVDTLDDPNGLPADLKPPAKDEKPPTPKRP